MKINWLVRMKNKSFWVAFLPGVALLCQMLAKLMGWEMDLSELDTKLLDVMNALFALLAVLGVVTDPTTEGVNDSERAMRYEVPVPTRADKPPDGAEDE